MLPRSLNQRTMVSSSHWSSVLSLQMEVDDSSALDATTKTSGATADLSLSVDSVPNDVIVVSDVPSLNVSVEENLLPKVSAAPSLDVSVTIVDSE